MSTEIVWRNKYLLTPNEGRRSFDLYSRRFTRFGDRKRVKFDVYSSEYHTPLRITRITRKCTINFSGSWSCPGEKIRVYSPDRSGRKGVRVQRNEVVVKTGSPRELWCLVNSPGEREPRELWAGCSATDAHYETRALLPVYANTKFVAIFLLYLLNGELQYKKKLANIPRSWQLKQNATQFATWRAPILIFIYSSKTAFYWSNVINLPTNSLNLNHSVHSIFSQCSPFRIPYAIGCATKFIMKFRMHYISGKFHWTV